MMYIVAIAWMFVVTLMAVVEAVAPNGSVLGAIVNIFVLRHIAFGFGVVPVGHTSAKTS